MEDILIPIFVCVVLPVAIVLIVQLSEVTKQRLKANIIIKAIEVNNSIDADKLAESLKKPEKPVKTDRQILYGRLLRGCIFSLVGLAICAVGVASLCTGNDFNSDTVTGSFLFGGASLAIGIGFLIVYFATRKQVEGSK